MTKKPNPKLSIREVADRLGENAETVKKWRKRGLFPHAELVNEARGPVWLIPLSDLANFKKPAVGRPAKKRQNNSAR